MCITTARWYQPLPSTSIHEISSVQLGEHWSSLYNAKYSWRQLLECWRGLPEGQAARSDWRATTRTRSSRVKQCRAINTAVNTAIESWILKSTWQTAQAIHHCTNTTQLLTRVSQQTTNTCKAHYMDNMHYMATSGKYGWKSIRVYTVTELKNDCHSEILSWIRPIV